MRRTSIRELHIHTSELVREAAEGGVIEALLRRTSALITGAPPDLFIRTADAVHLMTAFEAGEREVWTNDRHMLASASYFGVNGRSI